MRSIFLVTILALVSTPSFARERAYRVVAGTAIQTGFALAWGMKGKNLDFEALDKLEDPRNFFDVNQDQLVNYLVDLENETILQTVLEPALVGRAGDSHVLHNHDTIGLIYMPVNGLEYEESAMALTAEHKWFDEVTKLVIVKRTATETVVVAENSRIEKDIENAILAKLPGAQRKKYVDYQGAVNWDFRTEIDPVSYVQKLVVEAVASHPKTTDTELVINARIVLKKQANGISVQVESASLKERK